MNKFLAILAFYLLNCTLSDAQDWITVLDDAPSENPVQMLTMPDGDFIIGGIFNEPDQFYLQKGLLIRTSPDGTVKWKKLYGSTTADGEYILNERFEDIALTSDQFIVAVGMRSPSQPFSYQFSDLFLTKMDLDGNEIWRKYIQWGSTDNAYGVEALPGGDFIICGNTTSFNNLGIYEGYLMRMNSLGEVQWFKRFALPEADIRLKEVILTSDQQLLTVGTAQLPGVGNRTLAIKTDFEGNKIWSKTYDYYAIEGESVVENAAGQFVLAGMGWEESSGFDNLLLKIDGDGTEIWSKTHYRTNQMAIPDQLLDLIPCQEGGYAAVGMSGVNPFDGFYLLRVNEAGDTLKTASLFDGGPNADYAASLSWATDGGVAVTGSSLISGGGYDLILAHFSDYGCTQPSTTGLAELSPISVRVSPNPASQFIQVEVGETLATALQFELTDASGRVLIRQIAQPSNFNVSCETLPSGAYFYSLRTSGLALASGKILIKH